jgi:OOP family OmpA-OmpF porin
MPEPAADSPNGAGSSDFAQLTELLVGPERAQLADLQSRFDDPARRAVDLALALPEAVKRAKAKSLREALEPVFEKAFENSVRKHPRELADAIYPVIGPAIRSSIAASIREFAENLNQIVEKSASLRAIRWRIEARVTGKPFTEILLARSLLYSVEQVFLIHRKSGLLLQHVAARDSVLKDADMIAGMLTAIQDFFSDSFTVGGQDLETVDTGRYKLWIQYGPKALLVGAVSGTAPAELKAVFRSAIDQIHQILYAELDSFKQDDISVFESSRPLLEACLLGQSKPAESRRKPVLGWLAAAAVLIALATWAWYSLREQARWTDYFGALKRQPGIVVTAVEKQGSAYLVSGLKDPLAREPAAPDPRRVRFVWQPYLSLNTPLAAKREAAANAEGIEHELIRFEVGTSKLPLAEAGRIEAVADAIVRLLRDRPGASISVIGRTDEVGSESMNQKLSTDRAQHVIAALVSQGVPPGQLEAVGVGNTQPLRAGGTDWDRTANRSVSFKIRR